MAREHADVLVVGAGPVGSLLAAELQVFGLKIVVLDPRSEPDPRPRAGTVHARTASQLARRGYLRGKSVEQLTGGPLRTHQAAFIFAGRPGLTLSVNGAEPTPLLGISQQELELTFVHALQQRGGEVRRGHRFVELRRLADGALSVVHDAAGGAYEIESRFVVGADGARSRVRAHGDFALVERQATMRAVGVLATLGGHVGLPAGWHQTERGWTVAQPNPWGPSRVIAMDFSGPRSPDAPTVSREEFRRILRAVAGRDVPFSGVHAVTEFSDFGRYAARMVDGSVALVGDAAHVHFPLGGQGMNTGLQDAMALGWRLARILEGTAGREVLDEFSAARSAAARSVILNTTMQSRAMNPYQPAAAEAALAMLEIPALHDAMARQITGTFQEGFVPDVALQSAHGPTTLALALSREPTGLVISARAGRGYWMHDASPYRVLDDLPVQPDGYTPAPLAEILRER